MQVAELKTAVKRFGFDDSDPLLIWINAAMHEIEDAYPKWSWLEGNVTKVLPPNTGALTVAADVKRLHKVRDETDATSLGGRDLEYWPREKLWRESENLGNAGNPYAFTVLNSTQIECYPVAAAARNLSVWYTKTIVDLVNDADVPIIPASNHYVIVLGAVYVALQAESEEDRAANAQAQFQSKLDKMITADMKRQTGAPSEVQDVMEYG